MIEYITKIKIKIEQKDNGKRKQMLIDQVDTYDYLNKWRGLARERL